MYSVDFQIVALTETWLTESIFNNEILPTGYNIYRQDRGSRGGGVMLAVKDSLPSKLLPSPGNLEIVTVLSTRLIKLFSVSFTYPQI